MRDRMSARQHRCSAIDPSAEAVRRRTVRCRELRRWDERLAKGRADCWTPCLSVVTVSCLLTSRLHDEHRHGGCGVARSERDRRHEGKGFGHPGASSADGDRGPDAKPRPVQPDTPNNTEHPNSHHPSTTGSSSPIRRNLVGTPSSSVQDFARCFVDDDGQPTGDGDPPHLRPASNKEH